MAAAGVMVFLRLGNEPFLQDQNRKLNFDVRCAFPARSWWQEADSIGIMWEFLNALHFFTIRTSIMLFSLLGIAGS